MLPAILIDCRIYAINVLMFATFPTLYSDVYLFSNGVNGLAFIGPGFGYMAASLFGAQISSKIYSRVSITIKQWFCANYLVNSWPIRMAAKASLR
jgi:hypothetical protein